MSVEVKQLEKKGSLLKLLIKGTNTETMNALRRAVMLEVPTLAIEEITIFENNSVVFDEMLAHRLALLPIKTNLKTFKKDETAKFTLEKEGPCTVYSKDIKSKNPETEIIYKKIPIVKLAKGQKIKMEMTAVLNTGKEHSKWQPAIIGFRNAYKIIIDKECDQCEQCIKQCPKNILELKAKKIILTNALECNACAACRDACKKGMIKIETEPDTFILFIESNGQLENEEILFKAVEAVQEKISQFKKSIGSLKE